MTNPARLSVLLATCLLAQEPTIRTNVRLVVIPVSVTDQRGHFVYDLSASDFTVLDNGTPRPARVDAPDSMTAPFDLVVLVQTSDISDSALLKIKKVGTMIQDAVAGANGAAAVVTFADQVKVVQDFTNNDADLATVFRNLQSEATRNGRLLDAVAKESTCSRTDQGARVPCSLLLARARIVGAKRNYKICCQRFSGRE